MTRRVFIRPTYKPKVERRLNEKNTTGIGVGRNPSIEGVLSSPSIPVPEDEAKTTKVGELLDQAKALTPKQRQELLDQLALASQTTRSADQDRDLDMWSAAVYGELLAVPGNEGGSGYGQLVVKRLLAPSNVWRPVQEFMSFSKLCELQVNERQSVYMMLAQLLVEHARKISLRTGVPLGPKLVVNCTGSIAGVFEQSFPGYVRAGLAKVAARQLVMRRA